MTAILVLLAVCFVPVDWLALALCVGGVLAMCSS